MVYEKAVTLSGLKVKDVGVALVMGNVAGGSDVSIGIDPATAASKLYTITVAGLISGEDKIAVTDGTNEYVLTYNSKTGILEIAFSALPAMSQTTADNMIVYIKSSSPNYIRVKDVGAALVMGNVASGSDVSIGLDVNKAALKALGVLASGLRSGVDKLSVSDGTNDYVLTYNLSLIHI